jgi:uncharacterized protein with von Willebrand factor type A (vWA) domain
VAAVAASRDLLTQTLAFGRMLRAAGVACTTSEVMDAVRALEAVDLLDRAEVYLALRTVLVKRREEIPIFDRCFEAFWTYRAEEGQGLDGLIQAIEPPKPEDDTIPGSVESQSKKQAEVALEGWEEQGEDEGDPLEVPGVSAQEVLMDQDFSTFPADQLDEVARVTVLIAKRLARRLSRRRRPSSGAGWWICAAASAPT